MINPTVRGKASAGQVLSELAVLFKARIVLLLLLSATAGAFIAHRGWPGGSTMLVLLVTGGLAASGASALNEYIERDKDALMGRTRDRPLVKGTLGGAGWVPYAAGAMVLLPVLAVLPANPMLALFLLLGAIIYVGIYTLWLKPRTSLNIVIGGAAGSCAVLSGSAATGVWADPGALLLALLIFFWTPIHFWALAVVYRNDYARAGVPMLPVQTSVRRAALWGLAHGSCAGLLGLDMALHPALGPVYLIPVFLGTVALLAQGWELVRDPTPRSAWRLFHTSNLYLALVLLAACVASVLPIHG